MGLSEGTASNRYTVLGRLAGGGMADIYLAKAVSEGGVERYVVLKRVLQERARDPHFAKMFLDEARLAAQLQHPNIAQVHDIGKLAGSYFFTMEYVHGEDVRSILHRLSKLGRTLPINHVLLVASGALGALHHAHERTGADDRQLGIVHRDVSPSNVMVSYEGVVKLLDFGVAKATQRTAESQSGQIKGKIAYLSPEQCQGHAVDRRSDIYSLGIVLWEMLLGKRLYKRDTDFATMMAIVNEPAPAPSSIRPDIPPEIDQIVMRALSIDPARRFATASEMLEAIETVAAQGQHVLSPTAFGRFLKELFGERPKPWQELRTRESGDQLTITGESVSDINVEEPSDFGAGSYPHIEVSAEDTALRNQLARAPELRRSVESDSAIGPRMPEGTPSKPSHPIAPVAPQLPGNVTPIVVGAPSRPSRPLPGLPPAPNPFAQTARADPGAYANTAVTDAEPGDESTEISEAPIHVQPVTQKWPSTPEPAPPPVTPPMVAIAPGRPSPIDRPIPPSGPMLPSSPIVPSAPILPSAPVRPSAPTFPIAPPAVAHASPVDEQPKRRRRAVWIALPTVLVAGAVIVVLLLNGSKEPRVVDPPTSDQTKPDGTPDNAKRDNAVTTNPDNTAAKPDNTAAKPDNAAAKPDNTAAKPDNAAAKPDNDAKPDTIVRKPDTTARKPDTLVRRPDTTVKKPVRKPDTTARKPDATVKKPDATVKKPDTTKTKPPVTKPKPGGDPCENEADPLKCQK